jgi:hypothetical protein
MAEHRFLTGASLHEPKGVATASANRVYVADGAGSGTHTNVKALDLFPKTVTVWDDYVVPIVGANAAGISPPGLVKVNDDGAGSTGVYYFGFSHTSEEEVFFTVQLPHRYKPGTNLRPHVHWGPTTTGTGNVVWGLEYCISINDVASTNTTIITVTDAAPGALLTQQIASFPEIVGTSMVESSLLNCRFFRKAADAADTYAADAVAMSFDVHFEVEKLGTVEEYPGA